MQKILNKNIILFYLIEFLGACIFTTAIWTFFFTWYLNFSFHTALFITLLSWIVSFIFEIPSWAWADKFGRKKLYLVWILLIILSFSFWLFSKKLYLFIISAIFNWIWFAITSWNLEALIHDSLEETNQEKKFKNIQANAYISLFIWRSLAALLSWYLFVISPLLPIYATIWAYILIFIFVLFISDKWQKLEKYNDTKTHIKNWFNYLFKDQFLLYFIIILTLVSAIWNIFWFTYQPYFKEIWVSITNIWILFAITWIFSAIWAHFIKGLQNKFNEKQILYLIIFWLFISAICFYFFNIYFAILGLVIISLIFWTIMSFWNNVLIQKSPKKYKSTILSIFSFFITIWYASFSLISWFIVDYFSLKVLYFWVLILVLFLIVFSLWKLRKFKI